MLKFIRRFLRNLWTVFTIGLLIFILPALCFGLSALTICLFNLDSCWNFPVLIGYIIIVSTTFCTIFEDYFLGD